MMPRPYVKLLHALHYSANFFMIIFVKGQDQLRKSLSQFTSKHLYFGFPLFTVMGNVEDSEEGVQFEFFLPLLENTSIEFVEHPKHFSDFPIKLIFPIIVGSAILLILTCYPWKPKSFSN